MEKEALSASLEAIFSRLEMQILTEIVDQIRVNGLLNSTSDYRIQRLSQLGVTNDKIKLYIKSALVLSEQQINRIFDEVTTTEFVRDKSLYKAGGKDLIDNTELLALAKKISKQTYEECVNITRTLGFVISTTTGQKNIDMSKYLIRILDKYSIGIASGTMTYSEAIEKAVKEITDSGIRSIEYASGMTYKVDVMARKVLMTGVAQLQTQHAVTLAQVLQTDKYETSFHLTARPTHWLWQGRVYTMKELKEVCGLGDVTGLLGANCYHTYAPFPEGATRSYTDEYLDQAYNNSQKTKVYDGKYYTQYDALQQQRRMENSIRKYKTKDVLLRRGQADDRSILDNKLRYRAISRIYKEFSDVMGLPEQKERLKIYE